MAPPAGKRYHRDKSRRAEDQTTGRRWRSRAQERERDSGTNCGFVPADP